MPRTYAGWFRFVAIAEAVSWIGLLVSMIFKYWLGQPLGVTVFGWIHGLVFTAYVVACLIVFSPLRWSFTALMIALVASVPPLATVVFERAATRRGLMEPPETDSPTFWQRFGGALRALN